MSIPQTQQLLALLTHGLKKVFEPCRIPGCTAHSLGFVCGACARYVCQRHAYLSPSAMKVVCASCIMEEHRELWSEEMNEPEVIEAEVVE